MKETALSCPMQYQNDFTNWHSIIAVSLTIIPRAQMGYESIAHEGEGNNCFSKIQLVGPKNIETKHLSQVKAS